MHVSRSLRSAGWRGHLEAIPGAIRSFDWRRLPNLDGLDLRAAVAMAIVLVVVLSAAWTIRARASARAGRLAAQVVSTAPAPVLKGLVPKQKIRTQSHVQPVAITGQHFVEGMSVTIATPDDLVTTYGSESVSNVSPTNFAVLALFEIPGTYHLAVRTPDGARSNQVTFVVDR